MILLTWMGVPALACGEEPTPGVHPTQIKGWTADARYFVFEAERTDDDGATTAALGVLDTRTDQLELLEGGAIAAWLGARSLKPPNRSATCDGAEVFGRNESLGGHPEQRGATLENGSVSLGTMGSGYVTLGVIREGRTWTHAEIGWSGSWWSSNASAAWSPDCRMVGWMLAGVSSEPAAIGPYQPQAMAMARPAGPVIHIMAHRSQPQAVEPIYADLRTAGFAPHIGPKALKDRDNTVVYTSSATADVAAAVASAVPGGATVEPLTWSTPADIIVAAGRSAVKK